MEKSLYSVSKIYDSLISPVLKNDNGIDAENLTNFSLQLLGLFSSRKEWPLISDLVKNLHNEFCITDERLNQNICGINFCNPIGLAAGFDKNGVAANLLAIRIVGVV